MAKIPIREPKNNNDIRQGALFFDNLDNKMYMMNNGTLIPITERLPEGWVNVKNYGAAGDGISDDTTAIQNALNTGKNIYFPSGNYKITNTITCNKSNILVNLSNAVIISEVPEFSTAFTFEGSVETQHPVVSDITKGSKTIEISPADAENYNAGDYIRIVTDENYFEETDRDYKKGEIVQIQSIDTENGIITIEGEGTILGYSQSYNLNIEKINFINNIILIGGKIQGLGTDQRQKGIKMKYVLNGTIQNMELQDTETGISISCCKHITISNNYIHDINRAETGYGIEVGLSSQNINVIKNKFYKNRHSFTTSGYEGVCMYINVSNNIANDNTNAAFNTHGNARYVKFDGNIINNCNQGISFYSPYTSVINNIINNIEKIAISGTECPTNSIIKNNEITNTSIDYYDSIEIRLTATSYDENYYIDITNNRIDNCKNGNAISVQLIDCQNIKINNNIIYNYGYSGIYIDGGFCISISNNQINKCVRTSTFAISIQPNTNSTSYDKITTITSNNIFQSGNGIKITSTDAVILSNNAVQVSTTTYDITATTILHNSNYPSYT